VVPIVTVVSCFGGTVGPTTVVVLLTLGYGFGGVVVGLGAGVVGFGGGVV
jgi:hypothetical protein